MSVDPGLDQTVQDGALDRWRRRTRLRRQRVLAEQRHPDRDGGLDVAFRVTNTGSVTGDEVPQVYLGAPSSSWVTATGPRPLYAASNERATQLATTITVR